MAIAPLASSQAGPKPNEEPKSQPEVEQTETGIELEAALPVAEPPAASDTTPRVKRKKHGAEEVPDGPGAVQRRRSRGGDGRPDAAAGGAHPEGLRDLRGQAGAAPGADRGRRGRAAEQRAEEPADAARRADGSHAGSAGGLSTWGWKRKGPVRGPQIFTVAAAYGAAFRIVLLQKNWTEERFPQIKDLVANVVRQIVLRFVTPLRPMLVE